MMLAPPHVQPLSTKQGPSHPLHDHGDSHVGSTFPNSEARCERCGYPLKGLGVSGDCPECGLAVDASHPRHRTGPPWQRRCSAANWLATARRLTLAPRRTYRHMRVSGSNLPPRLFLLSICLLVGLEWGVLAGAAADVPMVLAWAQGMIAVNAVIVLTYVETMGVAFFSHRRGWLTSTQPGRRWTVHLAERVACYAALGWLPAGAVLGVVYTLDQAGWLQRHLPAIVMATPSGVLFIYTVIAAVAVLGFETLVWLGVRQVRYANAD